MPSNNELNRIAMFLPNLMGGGAEKVFANLGNEFCNLGYSVDIILANKYGPYLTELHSNVNVIDLKQSRIGGCIGGLSKYLLTSKPDVLLSGLLVSNIVALVCGSIANVKTFPCIHSIDSIAIKLENQCKKHIIKHLYPILLKKATSIIAVSCGVASDLTTTTRIREGCVDVIYNPIVTDVLLEKSNEIIDESWFSKDGRLVLLSAGRLSTAKDYPTLIKAFNIVTRHVPSQLIILGEGDQRQYLQQLVSDMNLSNCVALPGFVSNPYKFMKAADVFVLSSKRESFGNVLVEAMACGCQIVSTDCPYGPSEILEAGKWGKLVPVGDYIMLSDALIDVVTNNTFNPDVKIRAKDFCVTNIANMYINTIYKHI